MDKIEKDQKDQKDTACLEQRYARILNNMTEGCQIIGFDWRYLYLNDAAAKHGNQAKEKLLGATMMECYPGIEDTELFKLLRRCMEQREQHNLENEFIFPDGSKGWFYLTINPDPEGICITSTDITDRKKVEIARQESERLLNDTGKMAKVGGWEIDARTLAVKWTEQTYHLHEVPLDYEPPLDEAINFFHPDDRERLSTAIRLALEKGEPYDMEIRFITAKGNQLWTRTKCIPQLLNHEVVKLNGMFQDITERKQAELALRKSENRYQNLLSRLPIGVYRNTPGPSGRFIMANETIANMFGYDSLELFLQCNVSDLYANPSERKSFSEELLARGSVDAFELSLLKKDGAHFWGAVSARVVRNEEGKIQYFDGIVEDITERKEAIESLRISEERFAQMFEHMGSGVAVYEAVDNGNDFVFKAFNSSAERITRISKTQVIGHRLLDLFPNMDKSGLLASLQKVWKSGAAEHLSPFYYKDDVREGWRENRIFRLPSGEVVAIFDEVTDRIKAEESLHWTMNRLKLASDAAGFGVWDLDLQKNILVWDDWMYRLYGVDPNNFEGAFEAWQKGVHPDDIEQASKEVELAIAGEKDFDTEFRVVHPNGEVRHLKAYALVSRDNKGIPVRMTGINFDITSRKKAEAEKAELEDQLRQSQKMEAVGTLAGGISHDFNNLLQSINGYAQLLLMEKSENDSEYRSLQAIKNAGSRASDLVQQLLLFSRKAESVKRTVMLQDEVEQARKMLERTIPKMVQIQVNIGDRLWNINADPVQIEQILLNLGTNAADAMPDGGKLLFEINNVVLNDDYTSRHLGAQPGQYVLLSVSDTGYGMDKETLEHIFDPFFTTKEIGRGTGLGLASVYGIVKNHGGYIICYSEVGQGTTFKIYFSAIAQPEIEETRDIKPKPIPRGTETILLVDDEEAIRSFAQQALMKFGYKVMTASTGEEALDHYSAKPNEIDLIVMDLGMPGMGGHKCLHELLRIDPSVKIVIASGYSINGQVKKSMEDGAKGYVSKPYQLEDLLNTVREVLDKK